MAARKPGGELVWIAVLLMALPLLTTCSKPSGTADGSRGVSNGPSSEYVGSEACRECHEGVYRGWQTTFHAQKFQPVNAEFIIGDFEKDNAVEVSGGRTVMTRKGDAFFATTAGTDGTSSTFPIKYVLGSIWKQRYITELPNGAMQILPVQWNVVTANWSEYRGFESLKPGTPGHWTDKEQMFQYQCMGCHATNAKVTHDEQTDTYKTSWQEMGVGCESCHGPGGAHVRAALPDKFDTIVNPPRMPDPRRAAMVCGACHDVGSSDDGQYAYPVNYRPGDDLRFHLDKDERTYPDGSPRTHHQQYNDWQASGHARAGVMCWDCHSPHVRGKFNRFQLKLPGSLLCNTCHTTIARAGAHSIHSTNNCIGCHMPNTIKSATAGDLRSHRMVVVRPEWTVKAGGDLEQQPNSCNLCHYHKDYEPERLVHFLYAVRKPEVCTKCHFHAEDDPEDYPY
jgi:predicted CXXCH cytochrome family protein